MLTKQDQLKHNKKPRKNRMSKTELRQYRERLIDLGYCQLCNSTDLDIPHHVGIGIKRDDTMQILLCVGCHRKVHNACFKWHVTPDQDEMERIAKENWINHENN